MRWLVLAGCLAWATSAWAQAPTQAMPDVSPPIVQGSTDVPYPPGAQGDAAVVLELLVDEDGSVSEIEVLEGAEPFVEEARRAVRAWRFVPARRGAEALAARIRARIEFRQPAEDSVPMKPPPTPVPAVSPPAATSNAEAELPEEIFVRGKRREIGETTLSTADVRQIPGAFGDPFRAVEVLPSVTPALSGLPYFFVRGAPPNNNGYFLDGVRVPLLFHVALGPGVIHPGLLERVDFHPGAAPASFGGFAGAIIAGQTRAPATTPHGEASLRLVDAGALLESPFAGGRGTALVAGRYGYPGPIISAFSDIRLNYWDYQSRLTWRTSERDMLSVLAFGSHDYLGVTEQPSGLEEEQLVSDFHRLDLRYEHALADGYVRVAGTLGHDSQGSSPTYLTNKSAALRLRFEQQLLSTLRLRAGVDGRIDAYGFRREARVQPSEAEMPSVGPNGAEMPSSVERNEAEVPSSVEPPPTNLTVAAHADLVWRVVPRVEVVPGVRVTAFDGARAREPGDSTLVHTTLPAIDPRLATRVILASGVAWLSSFGLSHQYPVLRVGELPALVAAGAGFPVGSSQLQSALQVSQGIEVELPAEVTLTATGFLSRSWGLTDLTASCLQIEPPAGPANEAPGPERPYFCPSNTPVSGEAHGLELLVRRSLSERLSGLLSYTLSRSIRESHFLTLDGGDDVATVPSEFDRTHVLNAILAYDLGRNWRAGSRFVFYSGTPYSALSGNVPVPPYNSRRDPPFLRLDVRLEKRWTFAQNRSIGLVFEGQNVTLSKESNTLGMDCRGDITGDGYTTECDRGKVGPITIPSIGVDAIF